MKRGCHTNPARLGHTATLPGMLTGLECPMFIHLLALPAEERAIQDGVAHQAPALAP